MAIRTFNGNYWYNNTTDTYNKVHKYASFYHVRIFGKQLFRVKFHRRNYTRRYSFYNTKMGSVINIGKYQITIIPNSE